MSNYTFPLQWCQGLLYAFLLITLNPRIISLRQNKALIVMYWLREFWLLDLLQITRQPPQLPRYNILESRSDTPPRPAVVAPDSLDVGWLSTTDRYSSLQVQ